MSFTHRKDLPRQNREDFHNWKRWISECLQQIKHARDGIYRLKYQAIHCQHTRQLRRKKRVRTASARVLNQGLPNLISFEHFIFAGLRIVEMRCVLQVIRDKHAENGKMNIKNPINDECFNRHDRSYPTSLSFPHAITIRFPKFVSVNFRLNIWFLGWPPLFRTPPWLVNLLFSQ